MQWYVTFMHLCKSCKYRVIQKEREILREFIVHVKIRKISYKNRSEKTLLSVLVFYEFKCEKLNKRGPSYLLALFIYILHV